MFATLQAALGVWPSESTHSTNAGTDEQRRSGVNETFNFESENASPGASPELPQPVFVLRPENFPSGKVFVPPFFVPPGGAQHQHNADDMGQNAVAERMSARPIPSLTDANGGAEVSLPSGSGNGLWTQPEEANHQPPLERSSRSPSPPPPSEDLERGRERMWSADDRTAFHDMVTASGYVNRYRLFHKKKQRMMHYLQHPDLEPMNCDGSKDHQTKYQAAHWTILNGRLYRKPESGRVGKLRRHLDEFEVWDVLTIEHLRSGHLGRDKMRKLLERRYIGYTLQEIMFVLKHCKRCAGTGKVADEESSRNDVVVEDQPMQDPDGWLPNTATSGPTPTAAERVAAKGPYYRKQTSNMMWF